MKGNPTMRSTLDVYAQQYADQLTPETKKILVRLADHVLKLVSAAYEADLEVEMRYRDPFTPKVVGLELPPARGEDPSGFRTRMRHNEPALNTLSDAELDVACDVVGRLYAEGHAAGEYLAERHEYLTEEERERMSIIAGWAL
jgi:hypothetical protein